MPPIKIAIVGAGISGLTLAIAAKQKLPDAVIEIYERDPTPFSRHQGYAIGLFDDTGLFVLSQLGLKDNIFAEESMLVNNFVINTQSQEELFSSKNMMSNPSLFRVQRSHIKKILFEALGDTHIYFNSKVLGYELQPEGAQLFFPHGKQVSVNYVAACDGASSVIRQQMIGDHKHYLGLTSIYGLSNDPIDHPLLDGGYFMTLGEDGSSFFCYRQPNGIYFSYAFHADKEGSLSHQLPQQWLDFIQARTQAWD